MREMSVSPNITKKSWVRHGYEELLNHEQGHYLIGSLAALTFKDKVMNREFSSNHLVEIAEVFKLTMRDFWKMERRYDVETNHAINEEN